MEGACIVGPKVHEWDLGLVIWSHRVSMPLKVACCLLCTSSAAADAPALETSRVACARPFGKDMFVMAIFFWLEAVVLATLKVQVSLGFT